MTRRGAVRGGLAAALTLIAASGCAQRASSAAVLTPTTDLGTIAVVVGAAPPPGEGGAGSRSVDTVAAAELPPAVTLEPGRATRRDDVEGARSALARVVAETGVGRALAERAVRAGRERTHERLVLAAAGQRVAAPGVDTVLELSVTEVGLVRPTPSPGEAADDPALTLVLKGRLRLTRVADGVDLLARTVQHTAETRPLSVWTRDDAREVRNALVPAVEALAVTLVDELF